MGIRQIEDQINETSLKIEHARLERAGKIKMAYLNYKKESLLRKRYKMLLKQETIEDRKRVNRSAAQDAKKAAQIRYGINPDTVKKQ